MDKQKADNTGKPTLEEYLCDPDYRPLVIAYVKGLPDRLDSLKQLVALQDTTAVRETAHKLAGAGLYCLYDIEAAARALEAAAYEGNLVAIEVCLKVVQEKIEFIVDQLPYL